jgi:diketogulonate reductase-like aldo/keto reductase
MKVINETFTLLNGVKMPKIGLGTWQTKPGDETYNAVKLAFKNGYRHIDTAKAYNNEESVGRAIKDANLKRDEMFITTKLPAEIKTYEGALKAFSESLEALDCGYIDLYLIHAPWPWNDRTHDYSAGNIAVYKAMEKYYHEGKVRAIGVSNFSPSDIQVLLDNCEITPQVNQIPYFIGIDQTSTIAFCRQHKIVIEAYSPLGIGYLLANKTIQEVAAKYQVSPAQICIRWCLQKETAPLPKTIHENRLIENMAVDFQIKDEDMLILDQIKGDPRRWG